jgi:phosphoglycolate phosphatase-like HAD superfamily hydrolase
VLVTDFDGVVIDGMAEYWWAARQCAFGLLPQLQALPESVPQLFRSLRPRVLTGWEMPVLAAAIGGLAEPPEAFAENYPQALARSLERLGWQQSLLSDRLDRVRHQALDSERQIWLDRHQPYPWMLACLQELQRQGTPWRVLTTKSAAFTLELLAAHGLRPEAVHAREEGPKPARLLGLQHQGLIPADCLFLEDRRLSLEEVRATPGLEQVRCRLASWGYLLPQDCLDLPEGIELLSPADLELPLVNWP